MLGTLVERPKPKPSEACIQNHYPHTWEQTTYYQPTWCSHCDSLLLGFSRQGYSCKHCIATVHEGCAKDFNKKVPCQPDQGAHQWIDKFFHHVVHCSKCESIIFGTGKICIYCRATAHTDPKCLFQVPDKCPLQRAPPPKWKCDICLAEKCQAPLLDTANFTDVWQIDGHQEQLQCSNPVTCSCVCQIGKFHDVSQKAASIVGGAGLLAGSIVATVLTAGAAAPVLIPVLISSGIAGGMGVASMAHGVTQTVKNEKMAAKDYVIDVGIGAVSGLVGVGTAGAAGALGTMAATTVAAHGGSAAVAIGIESGAVAVVGAGGGIANQMVNDTIEVYGTKRKEEMTFGRNVALSALTGAVSGAISVGATHIDTAAATTIKKGLANATDDAVNYATTATTMAIKGSTKVAEGAVKVGITKELKKEEVERDDVLTSTATGLISTMASGLKH